MNVLEHELVDECAELIPLRLRHTGGVGVAPLLLLATRATVPGSPGDVQISAAATESVKLISSPSHIMSSV